MHYKTYIFDFDGTLVDSMPTWSGKMINILHTSGTDYPADIIKIITPLGDLGTAAYFRDVLGVKRTVEEMLAQMDDYALPKYRDEIGFKEGVYEYLKILKDKGCSLNVLTASPHKMVDPCLKRLGVFDWFDNVWTCDDFKRTKSDVLIYTEAAARIGSAVTQTVFFDDNINALNTAAQSGMFTVGVYDKSGEDFAEQMKGTADLYVYSFRELKDMLPVV